MAFFVNTAANFRKIIDTFTHYKIQLPANAVRRLRFLLILERATRKPSRSPSGKELSLNIRSTFENDASLFGGYMVLFAHDDAVDKYHLTTAQIYDQLSRCLVAIIIGMYFEKDLRITRTLRSQLSYWDDRMSKSLSERPDIVSELPHLFSNSSLLNEIGNTNRITIQHLLFQGEEHEALCNEWLNMTIVSALEMGKVFQKISKNLQVFLSVDDIGLQQRREYLLLLLVKSMYAQAHSFEQKDIDSISYERLAELAYIKSTVFMDIRNYISYQTNEQYFFNTRHNSARYCEQIYDDPQDFVEDTYDGVINIIHMHIIEQGRLAERFLALPEKQKLSRQTAYDLLGNIQISNGTYNGAYLYQNPYVQAPRDSRGNLTFEAENVKTVWYEVWANTPTDINLNISALAQHRLTLYKLFYQAWKTDNYLEVINIVYKSNFPVALLDGLYKYRRKNKKTIVQSYKVSGSLFTGYASYYMINLGVTSLRLYIMFKKSLRRL